MRIIKINKRLKMISAYLLDSKKIIDIGCDHALLDIYLCQNRKDIKMIASDINEKPLLKAKENIIKYHMEEKIKIKQADGLLAMDDDVDTIIISGMGATTMINILKKIHDYPRVSKLILSPNNDFDLLRYKIQELGFKISRERIIKDNKYYLIIEFIKGEEKVDNFFGKLDLNDDINKEYYTYLYYKNQRIIMRLNNDIERKETLIKENEKICQIINFMK